MSDSPKINPKNLPLYIFGETSIESDGWPTAYTYEYEERTQRGRKLWLIVGICFILAGLGFAALYLLTGG